MYSTEYTLMFLQVHILTNNITIPTVVHRVFTNMVSKLAFRLAVSTRFFTVLAVPT